MTELDIATGLGLDTQQAGDLLSDFDSCGYLAKTPDGVSLTDECLKTQGIIFDGRLYRWSRPEPARVNEALARRARNEWTGDLRCDPSGHPLPTEFKGYGWQWDNAPRPVCPVCRGGHLEPHVYCLYCDRWGLDAE